MLEKIKHIILDGDEEQKEKLVSIMCDMMDDISRYSRNQGISYKKELEDLCDFEDLTEEEAIKWVSGMKNSDGTVGAHWSLEQTNSVARSHGIRFDTFSKYDWFAVLNMMYSDYYGAVSNDLETYVRMALAFLQDKDAKLGKTHRYYESVV